MSKKPSHIPFFPDAYLRDNYRLTLEQHGLFLVMLMEAWTKPECMLPGDDESLAAIAQIPVARFRKICGPVLSQWTRDGDKIFSRRLVKERRYVDERASKRRDAANARWSSKSNANAYPNGMHLGEGEGEGVLAGSKTSDREGDAREDFDRASFPVIRGGRS